MVHKRIQVFDAMKARNTIALIWLYVAPSNIVVL